MAKKIAGNPVVALTEEGGLATVVHQSAAHAIEYLRNEKLGGAMIADLATRVGVTPDNLLQTLRLVNDTIRTRITENGDLFPAERDRIYRVEKVLARANALLEDASAAQIWISRSNRSLGGVSPLSLLDTEAGYELVLDTLGRIEYGVIS